LGHVFIHRSIKTRIETIDDSANISPISVFIHRSIKTRIETYGAKSAELKFRGFLYIDPLKQGLKRRLRYKLYA